MLLAPTQLKQMSTNITARSSKHEILDSAVEIIDSLESKVNTMKERQTVLIGVIGIMSVLLLF